MRTTTAADLSRRYEHYSRAAAEGPVIVTEDGEPRAVLLSIDEYERLKRRDQQAFKAADAPERFLADIEASAAGRPV